MVKQKVEQQYELKCIASYSKYDCKTAINTRQLDKSENLKTNPQIYEYNFVSEYSKAIQEKK